MKFAFKKISFIKIIFLSFLIGIILNSLFHFSLLFLIFVVLISLWSLFFLKEYKYFFIITIIIISVTFWRFSSFSELKESYSEMIVEFYNSKTFFIGEIKDRPIQKLDRQEFTISQVYSGQKELKGKLLVKTKLYPEFHYGNLVRLECSLKQAEENEDFDYREYLFHEGIYGICDYPEINVISEKEGSFILRNLNRLRDKIEKNINKYLPEPEASLLAGITVGVKRYLPEEFNENLKRTGTTHIVVVSGSNITLVLMFIMSLSVYIGNKKALILSLVSTFLYSLLVGFDPPVLRSFSMIIPVIIAKFYGREVDILDNLFLVGILLIFMNPFLIYNLSFQLSFMSTLGLILLVPIFQRVIRLPKVIEEALVISLAAQIMTLPITAYSFQKLSLFSILVNLMVIPIVAILTYAGFVFILISFISGFLAQIFGLIIYFPLTYFVRAVNFFGNLKWISIDLEKIPLAFIFIYYLLLLIFILIDSKKEENEK